MTDNEQLDSLTKNQKRFLSRRMCAWCEQPLNRPRCGSLFDPCTEEVRVKRRADCLKTYKPRKKK